MRMSVLDIHLAAFLQQNGIPAKLEKGKDGRVVFCYEPDERFFSLQDEFNRNVDLQLFVSCLKRLRGRMLDARDDRTNGKGRYCGNGEIHQ